MDLNNRFLHMMELSVAQLDFQLSPSRSAKDANGVLAHLTDATKGALGAKNISVLRDVEYGPRARQRLDVFKPISSEPVPCILFVHGGFWQEGDKSVSGFAARTFTDIEWAYVSVGYTLTPEVGLTEVIAEITAAVRYVHSNASSLGIDPDRIILAGHSAGGHLAASILVSDAATCIAGAVLISGVFELAPIARSYVSALTPINASDIETASPIRKKPNVKPIHILVGADEPDAFQVQTEALISEWRCHLPDLSQQVVVGRDHFDVLYELTDPNSATVMAIRAMV